MGREVRMVPANWEHPMDGEYINGERRHVPLLDGAADEAIADWDEQNSKWESGFRKDWGSGEWKEIEPDYAEMSYEDWGGPRPRAEEYMPVWPDEQRTHFMMYETTSEGTPISPAFSTPEDLARWLADNNASAFGDSTASYEEWLRVARGGFAPSAVVENGIMRSGVSAITD